MSYLGITPTSKSWCENINAQLFTSKAGARIHHFVNHMIYIISKGLLQTLRNTSQNCCWLTHFICKFLYSCVTQCLNCFGMRVVLDQNTAHNPGLCIGMSPGREKVGSSPLPLFPTLRCISCFCVMKYCFRMSYTVGPSTSLQSPPIKKPQHLVKSIIWLFWG